MSDGKISSAIVSRRVVGNAEPRSIQPAHLKGVVVNRVVEEGAPSEVQKPAEVVAEVDIKALVAEALAVHLKALDETYRTKMREIEADYNTRVAAIEKTLKTKLAEHVSSIEKNKPVVNVTVENRTKVTRLVKRDDRGLITEIHEETETVK